LAERLDVLERMAGRWLAKTNPFRHSPRGRYWAPPARKPASGWGGVLTRDRLVVELQTGGLLFREARQALNVILKTMIKHLKVAGELETLLGKFDIKDRPPQKKVKRFDREVTLNRQSKRVAFRLEKTLKAALQSAPQKEIPMPESKVSDPLRCQECGSLEFTEAKFRQYRDAWYSSMPGGDLRPVTESPLRTLVCLCGNPIQPGRQRGYGNPELVRSFQPSFEVARRYRNVLGRIRDAFATKQQYDHLAERIAKLERMLQRPKKKPK
jgi:nucleoid DNA-binding protein